LNAVSSRREFFLEFAPGISLYLLKKGGTMSHKVIFCLFVIFSITSIGFCQEEVTETDRDPQIILQLANNGPDMPNPYSRAIGQRVVGWILTGSGTLNTVLGLLFDAGNVYADSYADLGSRETGETLEKIIWIEGLVQLGIGLPFVIIGSVQHGKWNKWEMEHKNLKVSFTGTRVIVDF
jgi:hypothetical protein